MKKLFFLLIVFTSCGVFSQETNETNPKSLNEKKHEVKVGAIKLLAGPIF